MNSERAGLAFLIFAVIDVLVVLGLSVIVFLGGTPDLPVWANLIFSELILLVPILCTTLWFLKGQPKLQVLGFRRIRFSSALLILLYGLFAMPLGTLLNAISMLFANNVVEEISGDIVDGPFFVMFFLIAIIGPFCEELAVRGCLYAGFRNCGSLLRAILFSSLLFGLMHENINQFVYAFGLGIIMALAREVTDSLWGGFLCHMLVNGEAVVLMYMFKWFGGMAYFQDLQEQELSTRELLAMIPGYAVFTIISVAIALWILSIVAKREGKPDFLRYLWDSRKNKWESVWSFWVVQAMIILVIIIVKDVLRQWGLIL